MAEKKIRGRGGKRGEKNGNKERAGVNVNGREEKA